MSCCTNGFLDQKVPSLLDSGSMVTLICKGYVAKNILPLLNKSSGKLTEAHSMFRLSATNNEVMPVSKYFEADVTLLGFRILLVGFLVVKDPNVLLEPQHSTQLPGVIGCNLIWLGYEEFGRVYGFGAFEEFHCLADVHPVVFTQLCSFYYQSKLQDNPPTIIQVSSSSIKFGTSETSSSEAKKVPDTSLDNILGQVWVGITHEPICIPANLVKVVQGKTDKITQCLTCMVGPRDTNNLPMGIVVNRAMVTPKKSKKVPIILANTNSYNVWIRQPLLATNVVEVESCPWDYQTILSCDGKGISVSFCPVPTLEVQEEIFVASTSVTRTGEMNSSNQTKDQGEKPKFGSQPKFNSPHFDFQKELDRLPFPLNLGKVEMSKAQQIRFLELIYDNQSVFSLCDEDLGLCDHLKHTIPTTMDKPIYLLHQTIPVQLQAEIRKCLDTWLKQGIIQPSQSPYALQVVIIRKKTGEIRLCINLQALNAITVRNSFPLP